MNGKHISQIDGPMTKSNANAGVSKPGIKAIDSKITGNFAKCKSKDVANSLEAALRPL